MSDILTFLLFWGFYSLITLVSLAGALDTVRTKYKSLFVLYSLCTLASAGALGYVVTDKVMRWVA